MRILSYQFLVVNIFLTHCSVHHLLIFFILSSCSVSSLFWSAGDWTLLPRGGGGCSKGPGCTPPPHSQHDWPLRRSSLKPYNSGPHHPPPAPLGLFMWLFFLVTRIAIPRFGAHTVFESCNQRFATSSFGFSKNRQTCQLNTKLIPISKRQEARGLPPEGCISRLLLSCFFNQSTFQATRQGSTIDFGRNGGRECVQIQCVGFRNRNRVRNEHILIPASHAPQPLNLG